MYKYVYNTELVLYYLILTSYGMYDVLKNISTHYNKSFKNFFCV